MVQIVIYIPITIGTCPSLAHRALNNFQLSSDVCTLFSGLGFVTLGPFHCA